MKHMNICFQNTILWNKYIQCFCIFEKKILFIIIYMQIKYVIYKIRIKIYNSKKMLKLTIDFDKNP